jgi:hypothetical protein
MTAWKITLLATQWLLLSAQSIPPDVPLPFNKAISRQYPMEFQAGILPPKQFDHPYDGKLTVIDLNKRDLREKCRFVKPGAKTLACTSGEKMFAGERHCWIWMMTATDLDREGWDYDMVMRHEVAHCNGWKHD